MQHVGYILVAITWYYTWYIPWDDTKEHAWKKVVVAAAAARSFAKHGLLHACIHLSAYVRVYLLPSFGFGGLKLYL